MEKLIFIHMDLEIMMNITIVQHILIHLGH